MLHKESLQDFARSLHALTFPQLGCPEHEKEALGTVLKFYILLRFRFFNTGLNEERAAKINKAASLSVALHVHNNILDLFNAL